MRRDLRTDFKRLKDAGREALLQNSLPDLERNRDRPLTGTEHDELLKAVDKHWDEFTSEEKLGGLLLERFQQAALQVLAIQGASWRT